MDYGKMVIVDNNTGARLCLDLHWRVVCEPDKIKTWVKFGFAEKMLSRLSAREPLRDPVILHLHTGDTIDRLGNIHRRQHAS